MLELFVASKKYIETSLLEPAKFNDEQYLILNNYFILKHEDYYIGYAIREDALPDDNLEIEVFAVYWDIIEKKAKDPENACDLTKISKVEPAGGTISLWDLIELGQHYKRNYELRKGHHISYI